MKQLVKTRTKELKVENVASPSCGVDEILIEVHNSLISSGTETGGFSKKNKKKIDTISTFTTYAKKAKQVLSERGVAETLRKAKNLDNISSTSGYSVSGIVISRGENVTGFEIGDRVAAGGSGYASHAEVVVVPKNLVVKIPDDLSFKHAAFTTVGSIALQGVRQANVQVGDNVVVIGLGLIGLITVQILKASGCRVIGVDLSKKRVDLAEKLGQDLGLVSGDNDIVQDVMNYTNNIGADSVIISAATSSSDPVNLAMKISRKKGRVVVVGAVGMDLERSPFYQKEIDFTISCSYGPGRYDSNYEERGIDYPPGYVRWTENRNMEAFTWLLAQDKIDINLIVTDEFDINDAPKAFEKIVSDPQNTIGVILNYPEKDRTVRLRTKISLKDIGADKIKKDQINIAVIGAGGFATRTHLPLISSHKDLSLKAVVTKLGTDAKRAAKEFEAEYCTTDYNEVLKDDTVDAVVIATRHNLHYQMALDSINAGKHVLVEKPMALTNDEIDSLIEAVEKNKVVFAVGYNRRYSPLITKTRDLILKEQGPLLINYRVNAGFIPPDHWTQDPKVGGGRIIGEGCHFFDTINYLVNSELDSIAAEHIPVNNSNIVANDNVLSTMSYKDGSIASLTYTSIGGKGLSKEYLEININRKTIILDDYLDLKLYGFKGSGITLKKQDKGHPGQMLQFINKIKGQESSIINLNECALAARMSITVNEIIKSRIDE